MSRWICVDDICIPSDENDWEELVAFADAIAEQEPIDIVPCRECRRVREDGGHANCNGYLYCRKWKTLVDEDSYCSWGERSE